MKGGGFGTDVARHVAVGSPLPFTGEGGHATAWWRGRRGTFLLGPRNQLFNTCLDILESQSQVVLGVGSEKASVTNRISHRPI